MKAQTIIFIVVMLSCVGCAYHPRTITKDFATEPLLHEEILDVTPAHTLSVGEELVYAVDWMGIPSGRIILAIKELVEKNGVTCYHVVGKAAPNRFFKFFFDIDYEVHTYINQATNHPVYFHKRKRNKKVFHTEEVIFDQQNDLVETVYSREGKGKSNYVRRNEFSLSNPSFDLFSALYYFRLQPIKRSQVFPLTLVYQGKTWDILAHVSSTLELLRLPGSINATAFHVLMQSDLSNFITGEKQEIDVYFKNDVSRTPLIFKMKAKIGSLTGVLVHDQLSQEK